MRVWRPAVRINPMTYSRPFTSASEYATRLTPSAKVPPAGRPNTLSSSIRLAEGLAIDPGIGATRNRYVQRRSRNGGGESGDETAAGYLSHASHTIQAMALSIQ